MIKCNVTVCGTVSRQAQIRANKEGKQFISFGVKVVIPAKSGINKTIEISVAKDTDNQAKPSIILLVHASRWLVYSSFTRKGTSSITTSPLQV